MLAFAVLLFLYFAADIGFGEDPLQAAFSPLRIGVPPPDTNTGATNPFIPDTQPGFANGFPTENIGATNKQTSSSSLFDPTELSFLDWNSRQSEGGIPIVEYFAYDVMERVKEFKEIRDAYQLEDFTATTLSRIFYDIILNGHASVGNPNPETSARIVAQAISVNFFKVKKDSLLRVVTYNVAKFLFYKDVLTARNAVSLSKDYFKVTERIIRSIVKPNPEANIRAIGRAVISFLKSMGIYTPYSTDMMAELFANEWYSLKV